MSSILSSISKSEIFLFSRHFLCHSFPGARTSFKPDRTIEFVPHQPNPVRGWKWECGQVCALHSRDFVPTKGTFPSPSTSFTHSAALVRSGTRCMSQCSGVSDEQHSKWEESGWVCPHWLWCSSWARRHRGHAKQGDKVKGGVKSENWKTPNFSNGVFDLTLWPFCHKPSLWEFFPTEILRLAFAELCTGLNYF